jgi:hypothetical protein
MTGMARLFSLQGLVRAMETREIHFDPLGFMFLGPLPAFFLRPVGILYCSRAIPHFLLLTWAVPRANGLDCGSGFSAPLVDPCKTRTHFTNHLPGNSWEAPGRTAEYGSCVPESTGEVCAERKGK